MSQNGSNMRRAKDVDQDDPYALHIHPTSFPPLEHGNYAHSKSHVIFMSSVLSIFGCAQQYHAVQMHNCFYWDGWSGNDPTWSCGCVAFVSCPRTMGETQASAHTCLQLNLN